ncbi:MAG TPA: hypothetical protein VGM19_04955 [Armatimonadota bacterium]|jgi:hypothetical protein
MNRRKLVAMLVLGTLALTMLWGCGGGGGGVATPPLRGSSQTTRSSFVNADGSRRVVTHFEARVNGEVDVQMFRAGASPVFDPFVIVFRGNFDAGVIPPANTVVASDDNSGGGRDAFAAFFATDNQIYTVWFTTAGPADFGTFGFSILDGLPAAAATAPKPTAVPAADLSKKL